ncbi:MAG: anthranilate phosphoribosyltransferase [Candidatus Brocadia sp.]|uniref:Anthranilate phosphoribosyltransferase n=1 Tax=Candidatus Brocadia fulgida TaxID=380242 RepID=A0A0M2UWD7_9BACT|nr:MAG: anthranilate phosphoribosyltransferase component II [Candidatus Brocadia fulgida]MCC6326616.1 anthranilate phosphoribosyltransferase [Candidatus Brocadia sp.]MCE7912727.1 anthranilate phosphoribosyltransferase [Candidatus Brocadia sp. AMX3]MDG5996399.1 anthranilate phosphoribosyltransferase [Candidatus Brocadia sp.]RIJ93891.1 MAG: anthranilate phosphoribosyltransferase [Candidatus Brocadia sp.]
MPVKKAITKLVNNQHLTVEESLAAMTHVMEGNATDAQIASFITALRMKGETVDEITGCTLAMRKRAVKLVAGTDIVVDTCGTGGDARNTFNISTAAAFVVAGAGLKVAKHGNRAFSSQCGSADVLMRLGVNIEANVKTVEKCLAVANIGFLFAPLLHQAMKYVVGPRKEIGIRTIFNIIGPLANPAGATHRVLGVYSEQMTLIMAEALKMLGDKHAFVVHGLDGLDEITTTTRTKVCELAGHTIKSYYLNPEEFGIKKSKLSDLTVHTAEESAAAIRGILEGVHSPKRDVVLVNAAAAIIAGGLTGNFAEGIEIASRSIDTGSAKETLKKLMETSWQSSQ